jgi:GntR family transcriptional regulator
MIAFKLDPKSGVPLYRQIQDQIRYGMASGRLLPGEQLPTMRALAVELSVNPNTVIKAYSELEREGLLTTQQGTGTFIAPQPRLALPEKERRAKLTSLCRDLLSEASRYGFAPEEVLQALQELTHRSPLA